MELILVDTPVWIDHLHCPSQDLTGLIAEDRCVLHPFVLAEIALGNLPDWESLTARFQALPTVEPLSQADLLDVIRRLHLQGSGLGFVDAHLLATVKTQPDMLLWTRDKRLARQAALLMVAAELE
jgi:hypothetical protein